MTNKLFIVIKNFVIDDTKVYEDLKSKIDVIVENSSIKNDKREDFDDIKLKINFA